jgi:hypothetical protein
MRKFIYFLAVIVSISSCGIIRSGKTSDFASYILANEINGCYINRNGQNSILSLFNIRDYADFVTIYLENDHTIKLMYNNDSICNEYLFNGKMTDKYFEIYLSKKVFLIPLIFSKSNIDRIRIGKNKDGRLLIRKFIDFGGNILFFGSEARVETPYIFEVTDKYKELLPTKIGNKWGYVDSIGNIIIPCIYDFACIFEKDVARIKYEDKWGLINQYGDTITSLKYDWISLIDTFKQPYIYRIYKDGKEGILDLCGNEIVPVIYDEIQHYSNNFEMAIIRFKDKYGIITRSGIVVPPVYSKILKMPNGYMLVKRNDKYYAVDLDGYEYDTEGIGTIIREVIKESKREIIPLQQ